MRPRPRYEGDPRLIRVMIRPQWIAALVVALAIAGGFAWLGKWQLGHAITSEQTSSEQSESVRPLTELTEPGEAVSDAAAGMVASASGVFAPGDFRVVEQRENGGRIGAWVTGHFVVDESASEAGGPGGNLAVAVGWAPSASEARRAIASLEAGGGLGGALELEGRYMPSDAVAVPEPGDDPARITSMAPAQLINVWAGLDGPAFAGYLVMHPGGSVDGALAAARLDAIDSVPPLPVDTINWLNLFYAAEWVVFAGFAVFFWYRLTRDAWEKEHELKLQAEGEG